MSSYKYTKLTQLFPRGGKSLAHIKIKKEYKNTWYNLAVIYEIKDVKTPKRRPGKQALSLRARGRDQ